MADVVSPNILSEHQAPSVTENEEATYNPTPEERKAIQLVEKLYTKAKRAREKYDQKWIDNYKFFKGKQWKEKRPSYRHSEVLNYIFSEVQTVLVILTDNRPTIECLPEDPSDYEFAEILSQIIRAKWDAHNWSYTVAESILDSAIYGTAIGHVPWKPELAQGLGDFAFETVDPFYFFPDANARSKVNDEYCDYTITAIPSDVGKLKKKYPDKADFIKSDVSDIQLSKPSREEMDDIVIKSPTDNRVETETGKAYQSERPDQALLLCAYIKDEEMIEEEIGEETDDQTGLSKKLYQTKKKYPNGRKIEVCNGVLLEDKENEYGSFPYGRLVDHLMSREFWGVGEVDQLRSPQTVVNKLVSYILDVLILMGNPIWVVDTESGIDTDRLTNQPGLVVEKIKGTEARRESGVQLQPYIMETLSYFTERVLTKLGSSNDTSKGIDPGGNSSGYAIEQLQEAAQTKLRGKSRNIEVYLKEIGDLMVDRILAGYTIPRVVRLTNNQNAPTYFKFGITEKTDEAGETQKVASVQRYEMDQESGQYMEQSPEEYQIKSKLDIRITTGTTLPFAKQAKAQLAEKLYDKGIIDAEEYLNQIDYPNKEKIIERLNQRAAAGIPPGPPQPGGPNANAAA
jgi:hypothetical protein